MANQIKTANDIKFPPIGKDLPYLITCNGQPFAGARDLKEATEMVEMYKKPVKRAKGTDESANAKCNWEIKKR